MFRGLVRAWTCEDCGRLLLVLTAPSFRLDDYLDEFMTAAATPIGVEVLTAGLRMEAPWRSRET